MDRCKQNFPWQLSCPFLMEWLHIPAATNIEKSQYNEENSTQFYLDPTIEELEGEKGSTMKLLLIVVSFSVFLVTLTFSKFVFTYCWNNHICPEGLVKKHTQNHAIELCFLFLTFPSFFKLELGLNWMPNNASHRVLVISTHFYLDLLISSFSKGYRERGWFWWWIPYPGVWPKGES